jgi:hypothetical protein
MSTAPVARDVIEIFERHGEWREKEAQRLLSSPSLVASTILTEERATVLDRTKYEPGKEMVQYWGFVSCFKLVLQIFTNALGSHMVRYLELQSQLCTLAASNGRYLTAWQTHTIVRILMGR